MTAGDASEPPATFPAPPRTISDAAGRQIEFRESHADDREALVGMYLDFDPADRAQGIPPGGEERIRNWLETVHAADTLDVVAEHDGAVIAHGMLVPDGEGASEVALFVLGPYQGAGIGTALLETMLGLGQDRGLERVWLTVERWNEPALAVYEKVGFDPIDSGSFEIEMDLQLD